MNNRLGSSECSTNRKGFPYEHLKYCRIIHEYFPLRATLHALSHSLDIEGADTQGVYRNLLKEGLDGKHTESSSFFFLKQNLYFNVIRRVNQYYLNIQLNKVMILINKHLNSELYKDANRAMINGHHPLILITDNHSSFLNLTAHYVLKSRKVAYLTNNIYHDHLNRANHKQVRNKTKKTQNNTFLDTPSLNYADILLSQQQLIDFLCDLSLPNQKNFIEYSQEKYAIRDVYKIWKTILDWEIKNKRDMQQLNAINVYSETDYNNLLFEQFQMLTGQGIGNVLRRKFQNYNKQDLNLQQVFYADIILSIMRMIPSSSPDHLLRGYFSTLVEFAQKVQQKVNNIVFEQENQVQVVLIRGQGFKRQPQYEKWNINLKSFLVVISLTSFLYGYLSKQ